MTKKWIVAVQVEISDDLDAFYAGSLVSGALVNGAVMGSSIVSIQQAYDPGPVVPSPAEMFKELRNALKPKEKWEEPDDDMETP